LESGNYKKPLENAGNVYTVDLPDAKIEQMLDWDKPLSEQPQAVRKAIDSLGITPESLGKVAADKVRKLAEADGVADWARRDLLADAARLESAKSIQQISGTLKRMPLEYGINRDSGPFASSAGDFLALVKATEYVPNMDTGGGAYGLLSALRGGDGAASEYMRSLGVPGIKYLDAGSRSGEKGTRNFVVFPGEEQSLTVLERNGERAQVAPKAVAPKASQNTWQGMSRDEFLGNPKITTNRNAADLKPRALTTVVTEQPKPFKGNLTIRMNEDGAAVYDGDKVVASYNFGDTLVVDKKYRKQGIGEELIYQWRKENPTAPPAKERTKVSQAIQEKVWQRLLNEQG
jgi:GNAT superfamily N-acetyltransferase